MRIKFSKFRAWRTISAAWVCLAFATVVAAQDWRGVGRLAGRVTDESGAPIDGATVKGQRIGSQGGPTTKTNGKGEFVLAGINEGQWNIDVEKQGYETAHGSAGVQEHSTNPSVSFRLKKAAVDPNVVITDELVKAADLIKQQKWADARTIYTNLLAKYPQAWQVEPYIARTYFEEKQYDQAIEHLQKAVEHDPTNVDYKLQLATTYTAAGKKDEANKTVASIEESKINDPAVLTNVGINLFNDKKPDEAMTWFNKTIERFPQYPDAYYYRGITEVQLDKPAQAKTDLQKFVELAPNAPEAATAKGILEKLK